MNLSDITTIREQVAAIVERLDAIESESKEAIHPEVFEQKLLNVFKAGLMQGRNEQYSEIMDSFSHNSQYIDFYSGNLNITGEVDYDDIGVTSKVEDCRIESEWNDFEVEMDAVDIALKKFKPEEPTTDESNTETPES